MSVFKWAFMVFFSGNFLTAPFGWRRFMKGDGTTLELFLSLTKIGITKFVKGYPILAMLRIPPTKGNYSWIFPLRKSWRHCRIVECFSFRMIVNLIQQPIRLYMKLWVKIEKYISLIYFPLFWLVKIIIKIIFCYDNLFTTPEKAF